MRMPPRLGWRTSRASRQPHVSPAPRAPRPHFVSPPSLLAIIRFISSSSESTEPGNAFFIAASSSSTLLPDSSALKEASRLLPVLALELDMASCLLTSASASICSTLSFMRSKAATEELLPTPASMSFTLVDALAVRARAMICSFLFLASVILASRSLIESKRLWIEPLWPSICSLSESASSVCCWRRVSASRARSSSPRSRASCAREYHFCASASATLHCSPIRFVLADTSA
mmetsp:Transcript_24401/g.49519  ORF Transcript_24401/g.49519 Transcript_24401/m.49519 type:complete len:233 (-) Transcript_24401:322-1020(-)